MIDERERAALLEPGAGPNEPAEAQGANPVERYITPAQRRERRLALERLLVTAPTYEEIYALMADKYQMSRDAVQKGIQAAYARLSEEHAQRRPYATIEAIARIMAELHDARKAKKFSAVANLELVLARIQGTEAPREHHVQVDHGISDTVLRIWGHLVENDPAKLREIVEAEVQRTRGELPAASEIEVVPVPEPVPAAPPRPPDPAPADDRSAVVAPPREW